MNKNKVNRLLFVTIAVMAVLPILAALYFVDGALETSLNLGFNSQITSALDTNAANLKLLGRLDSAHQQEYRQQFEQNENLRAIYSSPEFVRKSVRHSLLIYFSLGLVVALLVSIATAAVLSRKISSSFRTAYEELAAQREKVRYLEGISTWQELAKVLAHEIKNPLTPIELLVTSLVKSYHDQSAEQFAEQLQRTQKIILEELNHLNEIVLKFSAFAKLPGIQMMELKLQTILSQHIYAIGATFHSARVVFRETSEYADVCVKLDRTLFRQVLSNIIRNGVEANPDCIVNFSVSAKCDQDTITMTIVNDGIPVAKEIAPRIFDPYVTSKTLKDNMGLGLAIVRKIVLEHGGDISYEEQQHHPAFIITLPMALPMARKL